MKYRRLGNSGLQVSEISLGSWLTYGETLDLERTQHCVEAAIAHGVNFFDTADVYGEGEAERALGQILKSYPRSEYVISTKCFFPHSENPDEQGLSRKHIMTSIERSLKNLQLDAVDILYCHRFDPNTPLEETLSAMSDLVRQGKIRHWGISRWTGVQMTEIHYLAKLLGEIPPVVQQSPYNLINRGCEIDVLERCERYDIGFVAYSPLAQGVLTGKYSQGKLPTGSRADNPSTYQSMHDIKRPQTMQRVEKLLPIATQLGIPLSQIALAWCLGHPAVSTVVMGATKPEQLSENVKASGLQLSPETLSAIAAVMENDPVDQYTGLKV